VKKFKLFSFLVILSIVSAKAEEATFLADQIVDNLWNNRPVAATTIADILNATEDLLSKRNTEVLERMGSESDSSSEVSSGSVHSNISEADSSAYISEMMGKYEDVDPQILSNFFEALLREKDAHRDAVFEVTGMLHARY
jgi:hypothetical protein